MQEIKTENFDPLKFSTTNQNDNEFFLTLRKRVNLYFKEKNIAKTGDYRMYLKVVAMLSIYLVPYFFIVFGLYTNIYTYFGLWILMGLGAGGCGLSIMHEANHGTLSNNQTLNRVLSKVLNLIGGNALNWKIQHNVLHHTYTNIHGYDEDITPRGGIVRFNPHEKAKPWHKYQYIYAWILYGLMTLMWVTFKEFFQLRKYEKMGLVKAQGRSFKVEFLKLIGYKILYYGYVMVIPIITLTMFPWYFVLLGFFIQHFITGFLLGLVFQPAHIIESSEYPMHDKDLTVEANWAVHQLETTCDFAPSNKLLSWYVGGLNYQVEHHLFPNICHVHYPEIAKIVAQTTKEYGIAYHVQPTFSGAIASHARMLKKLGV
jgi:linoleoyl-CoA desaturase